MGWGRTVRKKIASLFFPPTHALKKNLNIEHVSCYFLFSCAQHDGSAWGSCFAINSAGEVSQKVQCFSFEHTAWNKCFSKPNWSGSFFMIQSCATVAPNLHASHQYKPWNQPVEHQSECSCLNWCMTAQAPLPWSQPIDLDALMLVSLSIKERIRT